MNRTAEHEFHDDADQKAIIMAHTRTQDDRSGVLRLNVEPWAEEAFYLVAQAQRLSVLREAMQREVTL